MSSPGFFEELKRRSVYKVAVTYAVVAWLLVQIATQVFPFLQIPDWAIRLIILVLAFGFPVALVLAWAFELTPEGIKRTDSVEASGPGKRSYTWVYIVLIGASASAGLFFLGRSTVPRQAAELSAKSIAVLPFANLSEDKTNAYFADGIQDEILTRLSKIGDLKVISRTSTQQFQSKPVNIAEIAKQLGVAHILEGSVQKSGDSVRVNVQLIKVEGDSHLWAETYDRKLLDTFAVESEVAGRIASSLAAQLTGREKEELARVPTVNPEAYEAYLRGLALDNSQADPEIEKARLFFRQAVELDPQFAIAWAYLANREAFKYFADHRTPEQLTAARTAAEMALKLRPDASESHAALGSYYYYCLQDYERALAEFEKARAAAPSSANAVVMAAMVKRRQGDLPQSIDLQLSAAALDPRNPDVWVNLGRSYRGQRRFADAREMFDRALTILPGDGSILSQEIETYLAEGNLETAADELAKVKIKGGRLFGDQVTLFLLRHDYRGAIAFLTNSLQAEGTREDDRQFTRLSIGLTQVLLGENEEAMATLKTVRSQLQGRLKEGDQALGLREALITIDAVFGDRAAVERESEILLRENQHDRWQLPNSEEDVARGFALLRDADRALPHLERALAMPSQFGLTVAYLRLDPVWDRIRDDPRFRKLAELK